jgi:type I restriction enzyme S subunit
LGLSFKETEIGLIPKDWNLFELKDKVNITMGQSPKSKFYNSDGIGIPFMQGRKTFGSKYHTIDTWCTDPKRLAKKGDVLMSVRAPVGDVNIAINDLCIGRGLASLRMYNGNNEFLFYLLRNYVDKITSRETGTVFGSINKKGIETLKLPFPSNSEQKAIANILSTLDEKIEANNKINKTLEKMAQTIFKHWFVDFEFPNENGEPYKSSGGEMVESELGMIPKGWEVRTIKEIALNGNVICGKTPSTKKKENYGRYMPFITIPDMHNKVFVTVTERYLSKLGVESQNNKTLPPNSICVSCIATPGLVTLTTEKSQTNQQINSFQCKEGISYYYMYLNLSNRSEEIRTLGAGGSTTLNLNKTQFSKIKVIIPPKDIMFKFHNKVTPMFELIKQKDFENITLSKIRDSILPKLMSGEIRVPLDN